MCKNNHMPRSKTSKVQPTHSAYPLVINFADDATLWFRELAGAVLADPSEIRVQFVGGVSAPPYEIISLRNALLEIPAHIKLVTVAMAALPPFTCAAWLVGDERRIARDALVWIPKLPEGILRDGHAACSSFLDKAVQDEDSGEGEEAEEEADGEPTPFRSRSCHQRSARSQRNRRMETDLRILADALNEWFPSWEFNGGYLTFNDLLDWEVVKPEWGFGGRSIRTRDRPGTPCRTKTVPPAEQDGDAPPKEHDAAQSAPPSRTRNPLPDCD